MSKTLYRTMDAGGHERGPFSAEEILQAIANGWSDAQTAVQIERGAEWTRLGDLPEFAELLKRCGKSLPTGIDVFHDLRNFTFRNYQLRVSDASCPSGYRTVATAGPGEAKVGVLAIRREAITFEQRLSVAGGLVLFLLGLLPAGLLAWGARYLLLNLLHLGPGSLPGFVGLLTVLLAPVLPFLVARRTRKFQRRFPIHELAGVRLRGPEVEFDFREAATGGEEAPGSAKVSAWSQQLVCRPVRGFPKGRTYQETRRIREFAEVRTRAWVARLTASLSAVGVSVDDVGQIEQTAEEKEGSAQQAEAAEFDQRLTAATPERGPWVTLGCIGLNVLMFICLDAFTPSQAALLNWGANWGPLTTSGQWGRLLSCCFLHWNVPHLLGNMYALLMWGALAERLLGKGFYLGIYLACGLAGSLASLCWHPLVISAGASGAVFGVCGALLGYLARQRGQVPERVLGPLVRGGVVFIAVNLFYGLSHAGIDVAAHAGGLLSGLLFGCAAARPLELDSRKALTRSSIVQLAACVVVVLAGLFALAPKSDPGYGPALNAIGATYELGKGVPKDEAEAVKWYRKAAEQGNASGQWFLGWHYEKGQGVKQDYGEAVKWYRKAAEQGNAGAQNSLGICYKTGRGVKQDYGEAVKWYSKAAEQGNSDGQANMGRCCEQGRGVPKDYASAVDWYRKAAEQGNANGQNGLGWCYDKGRGVEQDFAEALTWYRKAAEQGNADGQWRLGWCYENGRGVARDYGEAVNWYRKGADQGNSSARGALERLRP